MRTYNLARLVSDVAMRLNRVHPKAVLHKRTELLDQSLNDLRSVFQAALSVYKTHRYLDCVQSERAAKVIDPQRAGRGFFRLLRGIIQSELQRLLLS